METKYPGIFIQNIKTIPPFEGVSSSTGAFVGVAIKGPINKATLITSFNQFTSIFGSYDNNSYLAYAVKHFFENGGSQCYVVRVVKNIDSDPQADRSIATIFDQATELTPLINVVAINEGAWGNDIEVQVSDYTDNSGEPDNITFDVYYKGSLVESYTTTSDVLETEVNTSSMYINITIIADTLEPTQLSKISLAEGTDGITDIQDTDFIGSETNKSGLYALNNVKVRLIAIPGMSSSTIHQGLITYVEGRQDCFAILDSDIAQTPNDVVTYRTQANLSSAYAGLYYPWIKASDPIGIGKNPIKTLPPSGAIMGMIATVDQKRGVHKAPAGVETNLKGVVDLEYDLSNEEQGLLNPIGVNCLRAFEDTGIIIWGARTLSTEIKYINVIRHLIYLNYIIPKNTKWSVFEPNDEKLWGKIKVVVEDSLRNEWKDGALKGETEKEAFYVKCDSTINTQEVIDLGRTYVEIGVAEQNPSEFLIFKVSLKR